MRLREQRNFAQRTWSRDSSAGDVRRRPRLAGKQQVVWGNLKPRGPAPSNSANKVDIQFVPVAVMLSASLGRLRSQYPWG